MSAARNLTREEVAEDQAFALARYDIHNDPPRLVNAVYSLLNQLLSRQDHTVRVGDESHPGADGYGEADRRDRRKAARLMAGWGFVRKVGSDTYTADVSVATLCKAVVLCGLRFTGFGYHAAKLPPPCVSCRDHSSQFIASTVEEHAQLGTDQ